MARDKSLEDLFHDTLKDITTKLALGEYPRAHGGLTPITSL